jgi:hypothetical protein
VYETPTVFVLDVRGRLEYVADVDDSLLGDSGTGAVSEMRQVTSSSASRATTSTSSCAVNSMVNPHLPEPCARTSPLSHEGV